MSTRLSSSASSISLVKRPLPPMSARGVLRILSPVVLMMIISSAPSSRSSGNPACGRGRLIASGATRKVMRSTYHLQQPTFNRSRVMYACASARGLPRVPILTVFTAVETARTVTAFRERADIIIFWARGALALHQQKYAMNCHTSLDGTAEVGAPEAPRAALAS